MNLIYEQLNKYKEVDYSITKEENITINNTNYYYVTVKLVIGATTRIAFGKEAIGEGDYKFEALTYALTRAYNLMPSFGDEEKVVSTIPEPTPIKTPEPKSDTTPKKVKLRDETLKAMTAYQRENNINTTEKLISYIQAWNPNIKSMNQLNDYLITEFLKWAKS